jgi:hypothetical protein
LPGNSGEIQLRIGAEGLSWMTGPAEAVQRRDWKRSAVADIRLEESGKMVELRMYLKEGKEPVCLLSGIDREELEWIGEQVRHKWKMSGSDQSGSNVRDT